MVTWLLTFMLLLPDGTLVITRMGLMNGAAICEAVGHAVELRLRTETPEVLVRWTCADTGAMS